MVAHGSSHGAAAQERQTYNSKACASLTSPLHLSHQTHSLFLGTVSLSLPSPRLEEEVERRGGHDNCLCPQWRLAHHRCKAKVPGSCWTCGSCGCCGSPERAVGNSRVPDSPTCQAGQCQQTWAISSKEYLTWDHESPPAELQPNLANMLTTGFVWRKRACSCKCSRVTFYHLATISPALCTVHTATRDAHLQYGQY